MVVILAYLRRKQPHARDCYRFFRRYSCCRSNWSEPRIILRASCSMFRAVEVPFGSNPELSPDRTTQTELSERPMFRSARPCCGTQRSVKLGNFALTPYIDRSESKDVVELVSSTRCAIGYSGMGFATPKVKMLAISQKKGGNAVKAIAENAAREEHPITRPLFLYTKFAFSQSFAMAQRCQFQRVIESRTEPRQLF